MPPVTLTRDELFDLVWSTPIHCLVRAPLSAASGLILWGSPLGSLLSECAKLGAGSSLADTSTRVLTGYVDWVAEQFRAEGFTLRGSRDLAMDLVGAVEGAILLASTMRSKKLLSRQLRRVDRWLQAAILRRPG